MSRGAINIDLGTLSTWTGMFTLHMHHDLASLKGWLAPLISGISPPWMADSARIEMMELNVWAWYWFGFISNNIMPL